MNFDDKVWENGIKQKLWQKNDLILVACSGGVDSMGLLEFFHLWQSYGWPHPKLDHEYHRQRVPTLMIYQMFS